MADRFCDQIRNGLGLAGAGRALYDEIPPSIYILDGQGL